MPLNFTTGWSASSLAPVAKSVVNNPTMASPAASPTVQQLLSNAAQANPFGTTQVNSGTNNLLAAIYGPDYQNLLQSRQVGGAGGVDSEFQKWMTNFLFEKTMAIKNAREITGAAVWDGDEARRGVTSGGPLGYTDRDRQKMADYDKRQRSIEAMLPHAAALGKMAAYTPTFGGGPQQTQQPMLSGWTPAGASWMPQQQPSAATQAGMQLTGMQRPNYAQGILNSQGGGQSVANTWQSRLMAQGGF